MRSFRLRTDGAGTARIESLELPFMHVGPTATADDAARMPPPELAGAYVAARAVRHADGTVAQGPAAIRHLVVVVSGAIVVAGAYQTAELSPGDVLLVDDLGSTGHTLTYRGDVRTVELDLADQWVPTGVVPPPLADPRRSGTDEPKVRRIEVVDEQARFAAFDGLHPEQPGSIELDPVLGAMWLSLSPDSFGDWHTEEPASLVVVLSGGFELEVGGGGGATEVFAAGDVCLVKDHSGQGHISRTDGETRFVALTFSADKEWRF